ncbi:hypothetical protein JCM10296v2_000587 [Rhodotorula toruloides]
MPPRKGTVQDQLASDGTDELRAHGSEDGSADSTTARLRRKAAQTSKAAEAADSDDEFEPAPAPPKKKQKGKRKTKAETEDEYNEGESEEFGRSPFSSFLLLGFLGCPSLHTPTTCCSGGAACEVGQALDCRQEG